MLILPYNLNKKIMMKHHINSFFKKTKIDKSLFLFLLFVLMSTINTQAQTKIITGIVKDEIGSPLPGVSVSETGTLNGVSTDFDGKYSINTKVGSTLTFGYLGYKSIVKTVGKENIINVTLNPDIENLDEIVVIGYGSVQKKDLTGSVAIVNMEKLTEAPVVSFDKALAGRVAGVQVSGGSGEPGTGGDIVIRGGNTINGDNSPLYVLDGFIVENFNPNLIDPSDIESMSVLKDASATAIYGVRGANGVIIITTKRAKAGVTKITYEARLDYKEVSKKLEVLGAYDFLELALDINEASATSRYLSVFDPVTLESVPVGTLEDYRNEPSRNWQDEGFRAAFTQSHKINISSGGEKTRFNASLNTLQDEGSLLNTNFDRINGRINLNHKLTDNLEARIDVLYSKYQRNGLDTQGNSAYSFMRNLITYNPIANKFIDFGDRNPLDGISDEFDLINIVSWHPIVSLNNEYRRIDNDQFIANLGLKYNVTPNITLESKVSFNNQFRKLELFNNSKTVYGRIVNKIDGINGSIDHRRWNNINNINTITYKKRINKHSFDGLLGVTLNTRQQYRTYARYIDIPQYLEDLGINGIDGGTIDGADDVNGLVDESKVFSLLGRFNYNYDGKYLFTASVRRDASSIFPANNRVGYFPSAAVSWNAHKEDFIKDMNFFSQLKFKAGYGQTGNDRIPRTARFNFLTDQDASYFFDGQTIQGQIPPSLGANPNLFWEVTEQLNLGVDVGLFDGRMSLAIEAYQKDTKDLLINADAAPSQTVTNVYLNTGHVRNRGLEITLSSTNINTKDFSWTSDFNISFNRNTIESLPEGKPIFGRPNYYQRLSTNQFLVEEGQPLGNMYGYISDGVYQISDFENYDATATTHTLLQGQPSYRSHQPGDEKYKDLNGDGQITAADKTVIGNGLPVHFGGFTNTFKYKNFELSTFLQWSYGNDVLNANRLVFENMTVPNQNQLATTLNRWTPENQNTTMHRALGQGFEDISSRIVEDGSYLRLKTVNFSYNFSKDMLEKVKVNNLKVFFAAQNLLTFTNYSGFDPDVSVVNSLIMPGVDYSAYPIHRIMSLGINVSF
jgi:TonB-linked SusC/RagA family outer membrane protein|tara:strand:- start:28736 stop:31954 length:3219 start_codon:yes stop_codon:yes gene_type:complete